MITEAGYRYNLRHMPLQTLHTLSKNKAFDYKYADGEELIVYPSDDDGKPQRNHAVVITCFEQQLVRETIKKAGTIVIGASRDNPPKGSLGAVLKAHGGSPQLLSYLSAILVNEKYCTLSKLGSLSALAVN